VPGWYNRLADGLQVFDASYGCGTIPVPALDPAWVADPTNEKYASLINSIVYAGTLPAELPAVDCSQQPTLNFNGANMYPHVNEAPAP
jgi:hypothetical protein